MTLADLVIKIQASTAGVEAKLAATRAELEGISKSSGGATGMMTKYSGALTKAGLVGGVALGVLAYGADKAVSSYANYGEGIEKLTNLTGMSAQQASLLTAQNALLTGSMTVNGAAVKMFAANMGKAEEGSKSQVAAFGRLGVSLKDSNGKWRDVGDVMQDARNKLSGMTNGAEKAQVTQALFGRGATQLAKWLAEPTAQMAKLTDRAKSMGMVMDAQRLGQIKKYELAQNELKGSIAMVGMQLGQAAIPLFTKLDQGIAAVTYVLDKVPGPLKTAGVGVVALAAVGLVLLAVAAKGVVLWGQATAALGRHTAAQVADKVAAVENGVATEVDTAAVGTNGMAVGEDVMALDARTEALLGDTIGTEANTAAIGANSLEMLASLGPYALVAAAVAADVIIVGKAIKAYESMREAEQQAAEAAAQFKTNAAADVANATAKYGANSSQVNSIKSVANAKTNKAGVSYGESGRDWYNPMTWAGGVDMDVTKPTYAVIGEAGPEHVTVTPTGQRKGAGDVSVTVNIGEVHGTDAASARSLADTAGAAIMDQVRRAMTGRHV